MATALVAGRRAHELTQRRGHEAEDEDREHELNGALVPHATDPGPPDATNLRTFQANVNDAAITGAGSNVRAGRVGAYSRWMIARAKPEQLSSVAPFIWRARS